MHDSRNISLDCASKVGEFQISRNGNPARIYLLRIVTFFLLGVTSCLSLSVVAVEQVAPSVAADELEVGRRIYIEGMLPSGAALTGTRFGNTTVSGAQAACVNCHRRSGMGQVEGDIQVPPITGNFLFATKGDKQLAMMDPRVSKSFNQAHDPYTNASLADAILHGKNNQGREMNVAMPRYQFERAGAKGIDCLSQAVIVAMVARCDAKQYSLCHSDHP